MYFLENLQENFCLKGIFDHKRVCKLMARINSYWRSKMDSVMLNYLMSISLNGPPIKEYNCAKALYRCHTDGPRMRRPKYKSEDD